jgi:hypothetical protein
LSEIARLERSAFSVSTGLRGAVITMTPLAIGFATGHPEFLYATFGAMFVISTEGPPSSALPPRVLLLACFTEATAFALGTLASTTGFLAIPLVGVGVFVALMAGGDATFTQVGTNTAVAYAVAVGLPGGSTALAIESLWLSLLGGLWALLGAWLQQSATSKRTSGGASSFPEPLRVSSSSCG